ncbi:hypothetical protein EVAR_77875_1 [Eumeta japonica]|uniref:Uncharacterized protein n=1 Tax=Eumeta variegata TaxID=151549 RepID=A0A4C1TDY4_EUMVA|nr:hypothetical protein EVAR_77875_1 [Eumeta japonica]
MSASFKNNASFVSRLPTIRRHKSTSLHSPAPHAKPHRHDVNASSENLGERARTRRPPPTPRNNHVHPQPAPHASDTTTPLTVRLLPTQQQTRDAYNYTMDTELEIGWSQRRAVVGYRSDNANVAGGPGRTITASVAVNG